MPNPNYCGDASVWAAENPATPSLSCGNMQYAGGFVSGLEAWFRDTSGAGVWGFSPSQAFKALMAPQVWTCNIPYAIGVLVTPLAIAAGVLAMIGGRRR